MTVPASSAFAFYSLFNIKDEKEIQNRMLKLLNRESLRVLTAYYGLNGTTCKDYDEIADEMGITVDEVIGRILQVLPLP